jgi:hypothetical protein
MGHYGFSMVPRLVMRSPRFASLPATAKWLYTCLKDICGESDQGECFYSLRNLEGLIHMSISTISRSVGKLVGAGLITAKKLGAKGREVFHIKIVNIWQENDAAYCSVLEQSRATVPNNSDTQAPVIPPCNTTVSERNNTSDDRAQDCFNLTDNEETFEEELMEEEKNISPILSNLLTPQETKAPIHVEQVRKWLEELGIERCHNSTKAASDLDKIAPFVQSKNDLKALYDYTQKWVYRKFGEGTKVFLGHLSSGVGYWLKSLEKAPKEPEKGPFEEVYTPSQMGMIETERDELVAGIWAFCPDYRLSYADANGRWYVAIFESDSTFIELGSPNDWGRIPQSRLDQAAKYGRMYWQSERRSA